jgi:hypothetical protein
MEEVVYKVNFDFESKLSGNNKVIKGASWFDHIFFFINQSEKASLYSNYQFSNEYLEHLDKLGLSSTKLSNESLAINWWSHGEDIELNRFLNSKVSMTELGLKEGWIPIQTSIGLESKENYYGKIVAREEWGFSGKGTYFLKNKFENISQKGNYVLSEFINKEKDYGVTFDLDKGYFFVIENYIDKRGQFKGGSVVPNDLFESEIGTDNLKLLMVIKKKLQEIGAKGSIQIDTFTYNGLFHPFVEVNYRKTMGMMIYSLLKKTGKDFVSWNIFSNKKKKLTYDLSGFANSFITSPIDKFVGVCCYGDSNEELVTEEKKLEKFFREI